MGQMTYYVVKVVQTRYVEVCVTDRERAREVASAYADGTINDANGVPLRTSVLDATMPETVTEVEVGRLYEKFPNGYLTDDGSMVRV